MDFKNTLFLIRKEIAAGLDRLANKVAPTDEVKASCAQSVEIKAITSKDILTKDELMTGGEKYRGQGIRFRPPYATSMVSFDDWLDEQLNDRKPELQAQA